MIRIGEELYVILFAYYICRMGISLHIPTHFFELLSSQWVELSERDRRQKVDRACRDAKKNVRVSPAAGEAVASSSEATRELSVVVSSGAVSASESSLALLPTSPVGSAAVAVDSEAWMYREDTAPNSTTIPNGSNDQQQAQQIWTELYRYGPTPPHEPLHTIPDDTNNAPLEISIEKATHSTAPVPVLEYSCGSLVYESSLCGSDSHDPTPTKPTSSASLQNGTPWGTNSLSTMDMNKSAISAMDFSSASLDWLTTLDGEEKGIETNLTLLDSVNTMDLNASYKSGLTPAPEGPPRNAHMARYDFLKREESVDTAIAGNLRHPSQLDASLSESFNMSLDLSALPAPTGESRENSRGPGRLDLLNTSASGDWKRRMYGGECSSSGELDVR